jgi:aspartate-semialdehyde dehydrogenase
MVGSVMLRVLEERNLPITELLLVASERNIGKTIQYKGENISIIGLEKALEKNPHIAIFSAGGELSKKWAPTFAEKGTVVIDNSSVWRMDTTKKLIVPEINAKEITENDKIIANPNCSTIQMVLALKAIHENYRIKRLVISTYQSVTGTGVAAVEQMNNERAGKPVEKVYPYTIDLNCFPHGGDFMDNGYSSEEMKLVNETRKILNDPSIQITATVVRIPVMGGHSEAINVELHEDFDLESVKKEIGETPGILIQDDTKNNLYPMPLTAHEKDEVFVGRLRRDHSVPYGLDMWVVADNLRKGAATNAIQIAEYMLEKELIEKVAVE